MEGSLWGILHRFTCNWSLGNLPESMVEEAAARRRTIERTVIVVLSSCYVALLLTSLKHVDSVMFGFLGIAFDPPDPSWYYLSMAMAVLPSFWMTCTIERPSQVAYWILYLTVIVPSMLVPFHVSTRTPDEVLVSTATLLFSFFLLGVITRLPRVKFSRAVLSEEAFIVALSVGLLSLALVIWSFNGFQIDLGLTGIYDRRLAAREIVTQRSAIGYLTGNFASSLVPLGVVYGFVRKNKLVLGLGLLGSLVLFSVEGSRSSALLPLFVFMLYPLLTKFRLRFGILVLCGLLMILGTSVLAFVLYEYFQISMIVSWRLLLIKGLLSTHYWDFFSSNEHVYMSDGIMRFFLQPQYDVTTPRLIGQTFFNPDNNANANIWAAAFSDFGYAGVIGVTVVAGVILRFIDSLAASRGFLICALMCGFIGFKWSDVALDTSILTHGTLLTLIVLYLLPQKTERQSNEPADSAQVAS